MNMRPQSQRGHGGFTLAEVLIAVAIFVIAVFAILQLVSQNMTLVRVMQKQRPDLGALASKTMMEPLPPDGTLELGLMSPMDEDFGGNTGGGDDVALYPNSRWDRDLVAIDATNGLYHAVITVLETDNDGQESEIKITFLMFRPDLAEAEQAGDTR